MNVSEHPIGYARSNGCGEIIFSQAHPDNLDRAWTWYPLYAGNEPVIWPDRLDQLLDVLWDAEDLEFCNTEPWRTLIYDRARRRKEGR